MSAFVDAAVLVAILTEEEDGEVLLNRLEECVNPITSPIALFESALGIARKRKSTAVVAFRDVQEFLDEAEISLVDITGTEADLAIAAFDRFGKGRHRAKLNMGDCFSYACAKARNVPLLCRGDDFIPYRYRDRMK
jgi:ribonuclease VapC